MALIMVGAQSVTKKLQFDTPLPSRPSVPCLQRWGVKRDGRKTHFTSRRLTRARDLLSFALQGEGYAVDVAGTATEARARLDGRPYTLVITDWRLPDGDGIEIANRAADLGVKTFIVSGYLLQMSPSAASRHELMMKPIRPSELIGAVQRSIGPARCA